MRGITGRSCWAGKALASALIIVPMASPAAAAVPVTRYASADDLLTFAEQASRRGDTRTATAALRALSSDPSAEVRAEARFRLAQLSSASGDHKGAALLLRQVLDEQPNASRVRFELAAMLHRIGDEQAALRELRALHAADLPRDVAQFVDRMAAALQATKPLGFHLEIALAPDSNINRATRSDTLSTAIGDFTFDEDAKARSGLGVAVRGAAQARLPLGEGARLVSRLSGEANIYRKDQYNDISLELAAGPELRIGRARLSAEAGIGQQWYGMAPYRRSLRLAASATTALDSRSQVRIDAQGRSEDNRRNDLQDGKGLMLQARYERALSPRLSVSTSLGFDRLRARDDAYSTRSWVAGIAAFREMGRMTLTGGAEVGRVRADERLALLPKARSDKLMRLHLGGVFRQLTVGGFAPIARVVVERNRSSIAFHDYSRTRTEFGISRAF
jgi:tetratricopeptide (TPR) repeat protein